MCDSLCKKNYAKSVFQVLLSSSVSLTAMGGGAEESRGSIVSHPRKQGDTDISDSEGLGYLILKTWKIYLVSKLNSASLVLEYSGFKPNQKM